MKQKFSSGFLTKERSVKVFMNKLSLKKSVARQGPRGREDDIDHTRIAFKKQQARKAETMRAQKDAEYMTASFSYAFTKRDFFKKHIKRRLNNKKRKGCTKK